MKVAGPVYLLSIALRQGADSLPRRKMKGSLGMFRYQERDLGGLRNRQGNLMAC